MTSINASGAAPGDDLLGRWSLQAAMRAAATGSPFIIRLRSGLVSAKAFNRWLYNDYIFVHACLLFVEDLSRYLACLSQPSTAAPSSLSNSPPGSPTALKAPASLASTLASGRVALLAELAEFRNRAAQRNLTLPAFPPSGEQLGFHILRSLRDADTRCATYVQFLLCEMSAEGVHWTSRLVALWALERVYCDSMWCVRSGERWERLEGRVAEFIELWANDDFSEYVKALGKAVEDVSRDKNISGWRDEEAKKAVEGVLKHEVEFWKIGENENDD